jgi:hypothetical protein
MILLSSIIKTFEAEFTDQYQDSILPSHRKALAAMKDCRTSSSLLMLAQCSECDSQIFIPHACGHRNCPHCQHHESQQWLERQLKKQLPVEYFLLTFSATALGNCSCITLTSHIPVGRMRCSTSCVHAVDPAPRA